MSQSFFNASQFLEDNKEEILKEVEEALKKERFHIVLLGDTVEIVSSNKNPIGIITKLYNENSWLNNPDEIVGFLIVSFIVKNLSPEYKDNNQSALSFFATNVWKLFYPNEIEIEKKKLYTNISKYTKTYISLDSDALIFNEFKKNSLLIKGIDKLSFYTSSKTILHRDDTIHADNSNKSISANTHTCLVHQ